MDTMYGYDPLPGREVLPLIKKTFTDGRPIEVGVADDRGCPLDDTFDPEARFAGLEPVPMSRYNASGGIADSYMIHRLHQIQGNRVCLSQYELVWLYQNWSDTRIPEWLRKAVDSGDTIFATDTIFVTLGHHLHVSFLNKRNGQLNIGSCTIGYFELRPWMKALIPSDASD